MFQRFTSTFQNLNENNTDLNPFEFSKWGGSFYVGLGICSTDGVLTWEGEND